MPAPNWEDPGEFFDCEEFATTAVFTLRDGSTRSVVGQFDDPSVTGRAGEYRADSLDPTFLCPAQRVVGIDRYARAVIDGQQFDVLKDPERDGSGFATVILAPSV